MKKINVLFCYLIVYITTAIVAYTIGSQWQVTTLNSITIDNRKVIIVGIWFMGDWISNLGSSISNNRTLFFNCVAGYSVRQWSSAGPITATFIVQEITMLKRVLNVTILQPPVTALLSSNMSKVFFININPAITGDILAFYRYRKLVKKRRTVLAVNCNLRCLFRAVLYNVITEISKVTAILLEAIFFSM